MPLRLAKYDEVGSAEHVTKLQRDVKTPMEGEPEENKMTAYAVEGDGYIRVHKVSDLGWRVTLYDEDGDLKSLHEERFEDEASAHRVARRYVEEERE